MKVCIIGTGYVGLVVGTCFAEMGHQVIGLDNNASKISRLRNGEVPLYEPGLDELLKANVKYGRITFTTNLPEAIIGSRFIIITVGTPPAEDGSADLSQVLEAVRQIGMNMNEYSIIITKSTIPIGNSEKVRLTIQEQLERRGLGHLEFDVVSNPEFLREGIAIEDFMKPSRIIIGSDSNRAISYMKQLYEPLTSKGYPLVIMDISSSELTKYAANAMLAVRISFMNEIAAICESTGADIELVRQGLEFDQRIGKYFLSAGVGYGGSCFPKDIRAIIRSASERSVSTHILEAIDKVNLYQKKKLFEMVVSHFGEDMSGLKVAVWGLSFKPETDDIREAPAIETIQQLRKHGVSIRVHDPAALQNAYLMLGEEEIEYFTEPYQALLNADVLLIFTEWQQYRKVDLDRMKSLLRQPIVFDGRNMYDPLQMTEAGFIYQSIGRMKNSLGK